MLNKGVSQFRFASNPSEKTFAEHWERINVSRFEGLDGKGVLDYLLAKDPNYPKDEVTERDRQVAATVIQWLGSPVGTHFLREVVEDLDKN